MFATAGNGDESVERYAVAERARPARGGDEINIPSAGKSTAGGDARHYSGQPIPEAKERARRIPRRTVARLAGLPGAERMAFYNASTFPQWRHKLFIGALKDESLIVLSVDGNTSQRGDAVIKDRGKRIRDVRVGPDGYLYLLTDEPDGELLKGQPE